MERKVRDGRKAWERMGDFSSVKRKKELEYLNKDKS